MCSSVVSTQCYTGKVICPVGFIIDKVRVCGEWLEIVAQKNQRLYRVLLREMSCALYESRLFPLAQWIGPLDSPNLQTIRHHVELLKESFVSLQQCGHLYNKAYQQQLFLLTGIYIYRGEDIKTMRLWTASEDIFADIDRIV